jgi:hypothetical protein
MTAFAGQPSPAPPPPAPPPPQTPQSATPGVPDEEFLEFLGEDDHGDDAAWRELLKNAPPVPQDEKQ